MFTQHAVTDPYHYYAVAPNFVMTSRREFDSYKKCASYDGKVKEGGKITLTCKTTAVRYVIIKRKFHTYEYEKMVFCEAVIIGRRTLCKYRGEWASTNPR